MVSTRFPSSIVGASLEKSLHERLKTEACVFTGEGCQLKIGGAGGELSTFGDLYKTVGFEDAYAWEESISAAK